MFDRSHLMDRKVLEARLREHFEKRLPALVDAVEKAPDGQWIAASEWLVREQFQALAAECYGTTLQARLDDLPSEKQTAFSPSGKPRRSASQQGASRSEGTHGRG